MTKIFTLKNLLFILLVILASCAGNATTDNLNTVPDLAIPFPVKPLIIEDSTEEGWGADIKLSITKATVSDSFITYTAISSYKGENVGLDIVFPNPDAKNGASLVQVLKVKSAGKISDNLLATLTNLYQLKADTTKKFVDSANVSFINMDEFAKEKLGADPSKTSDTTTLKIFFEPKNPDDYAELYLNFDAKDHWVEIREKDNSYRPQVIKYLMKQ